MKDKIGVRSVFGLLAVTILVTAVISHSVWSNPGEIAIVEHSFIKAAKYVIENDDGTYKAFDGQTGELAYSGTSASTVINNAIDGLPVGGGLVKLKEGTFTLTNSISIQTDNMSLIGCGSATVLSGAIAGSYIHVGDGATALTGIVIQNLRIDGSSQTSGNGIFFEGTTYYHITNSLISRCTIHDVKSSGMYLEDIDYCVVENNLLDGNSVHGLHLRCSSDNLITKNTCKGNTVEGMFVYRADSNSIIGNVALENKESGIHLFDSEDDLLSGNICHNNEKDGMKLWYNSDTNLAIGNNYDTNAHYGINVSTSDCNDNRIENNNFIGNLVGAVHNSGTATIIKYNMGFVTEASGLTRNLADGGWISHGLAGTPDVATITSLNATYGGYGVIVAWDQPNTNSTHIAMDISWAHNGTAISDAVIDVSWIAEYVP